MANVELKPARSHQLSGYSSENQEPGEMYFFITFFVFSIRDKGLFQRKNLNPIIIRVIDEIQSHLFILEANTAHFLVELAYFIVVACHTD